MHIIDYVTEDGGMNACIDDTVIHLTQEDLAEYEQIIRDTCV